MNAVTLPAELWADVDEGTEALVEEWRVQEQDTVTAGQVLGSVVLGVGVNIWAQASQYAFRRCSRNLGALANGPTCLLSGNKRKTELILRY